MVCSVQRKEAFISMYVHMGYSEGLHLATVVTWSTMIFASIGLPSTIKTNGCVCLECGRLGNKARIYGGKSAQQYNYPWMALIRYRNNKNPFRCGGSLINNYYVLTAAHCVEDIVVNDLAVYLGVHNYNKRLYGQARMYKVSKIFVHPDHFHGASRNKSYPTNDISLIKLNEEVIFNNFIRPICLLHSGDDFSAQYATVAGWGFTEDGKYASFLKYAVVEILTSSQCNNTIQKWLGYNETKNLPNILCTFDPTTQSCQGDSGSPLMETVDKDIMVQIGLVSFGVQCPTSEKKHLFQIMPTFFTKISAYVDWVFSITSDAEYCWNPIVHACENDVRYRSKNKCRTYRRNLIHV